MRGVLRACDVGHRVVVRRAMGTGEHGRTLYSDLLGELLAVTDDQVTVRSDDGAEHVIATAEVAAGKRIPPRPTRFSEMAALERTADQAWWTPHREQLGGWSLRYAAGFTNRANSALPLGDPDLPLPDAVDACVRWYQQRQLPPRITVPLPLRRDVRDVLVERGWHAQPPVLVQTATLRDILATGEARSEIDILTARVPRPEVRVWQQPTPGFLRIITARKAGLPAEAHTILNSGEVRFAELGQPDADGPGAIARAARVGDWMHLGLVEVVEAGRRRGWAKEVTRALVAWAVSVGATKAVLQVEQHNTAALRLYESLGFRTHHTYVTYRYEA